MTSGATSILYSSNGNELAVAGGSANSSSNRAFLIAGSDGSINRLITLDTSGRTIITGSGTAGIPTGGVITIQGITGGTPIPINGTVTSNQGTSPWISNIMQFGGNNIVTGIGGSGIGIPRITVSNDSNILATQSGAWTVAQGNAAPLSGRWPVQITDGTNIMPTADISARASFHKITDGTDIAAVKPASSAAIADDPALVVAISPNNIVFVKDQELATFAVLASNIPQGNNKSMLSLSNSTGSSVIIKIRKIFLRNSQTTAVTGVVGVFELRRFVTHSLGNLITPVSYDTADTLSGNVTARTGATITGESSILARWEWSTDDWGPGTLDQEGLDHAMQVFSPLWSYDTPGKGLTLRPNEGIHLKFATNSTAGTWDIRFTFTQE